MVDMAITVGDVFTKFPSFRPEDMEKLVGNKNYNGRTTISLNNIAQYQGQYAKELSIFVASREKQDYTKLLSDNQRTQVNEQTGIKDDKKQADKNNSEPANIPMDESVFDIAKLRGENYA